MYIDSTGASNASIDTLADLGITTTSHTITLCIYVAFALEQELQKFRLQ